MSSPAGANKLSCPDSDDDLHAQESTATSAPEIKLSKASPEDGHRWAKAVKPLTIKAIKLAKAQRASAMEEGIEHNCPSPQIYVGQLNPLSAQGSGCEHRIVTRPADGEHVWVQVVAICKYTWSCCSVDEGKSARAASGNSAGFTLEGPLNPGPTPAPSGKSIKH